MYAVKIFFKSIALFENEKEMVKEYFDGYKNEEFIDFHFYPIFDEEELSHSVQADINIWIVDPSDEIESDEKKFVLKFYGINKLFSRLDEVLQEIKKLFGSSEMLEGGNSVPKIKIAGELRVSIVRILNYFITDKSDEKLYELILEDENYDMLKGLVDMLNSTYVNREVLQALITNINEIDLDEFFEIVKNNTKLGSKFGVTASDNSLDMTVGGKVADVGADAASAKQSLKGHTSIGNMNPFHGLFK